jgi:hypothetical protein
MKGTATGTEVPVQARRAAAPPVGLCEVVPQPVGAAGAIGVSPSGAHCDHVHAHGDQTVGTMHAVVTALANGFMSSAMLALLVAKKVSFQADAVDAVFEQINIGGAIANPTPTTRGTHAVLAYAKAAIQGIAWQRFLPAGFTTGNRLQVRIYWVAATAIVGDVVWAVAFERDNAGRDITADGFAALQAAAPVTTAGALGVIVVSTVILTQAQADGVAAGEPLRLFVQRTATDAGDTMLGDAQLVRVEVEEILP